MQSCGAHTLKPPALPEARRAGRERQEPPRCPFQTLGRISNVTSKPCDRFTPVAEAERRGSHGQYIRLQDLNISACWTEASAATANMVMIEKNNLDIARVVHEWVLK